MPLFPLPVEQFGGLNLVDAIDEIGFSNAVDLLNVDLDKPGIVRSRDGYTKFTSSSLGGRPRALLGVAQTSGATYLLASAETDGTAPHIYAMSASGAVAATSAALNLQTPKRLVAYGNQTNSYIFSPVGSASNNITAFDVNAGTFSNPATPAAADLIGVFQNRLALVSTTDGPSGSRVRFSGAGTPTVFATNDWVDLSPGDNEVIMGAAEFGDLMFVFKQTKFFVFYGTSVDATGNPIFNYRTVNMGVGIPPWARGAVCASPEGVYFVGADGIYLTKGGPPTNVSPELRPLFIYQATPSYGGNPINQSITQPPTPCLHWSENRLYFACITTTNTAANLPNDTVFVRTETGAWTRWNVPIAGFASWRGSNALNNRGPDRLYFSYASGNNDIGYFDFKTRATTDDGAAITSNYQSGFDNIAPPRRFAAHYLFGNTRKRLRKWKVTGSGTVSFSIAHDFKSAGTASTLTLPTSPAIGDKWHNIAGRGQLFSYKLSGTSPWTVQKLTAYLAGSEPPLLGNPSDAS